jgi:hypothetical protein
LYISDINKKINILVRSFTTKILEDVTSEVSMVLVEVEIGSMYICWQLHAVVTVHLLAGTA